MQKRAGWKNRGKMGGRGEVCYSRGHWKVGDGKNRKKLRVRNESGMLKGGKKRRGIKGRQRGIREKG